MAGQKPYVVLVTGGHGFLGQHIVGLLQTKADHVTEIRVLDVAPYVNKLEYKHTKPLKHFTGSVADLDLVLEACKGVDCVMHIASVVDTSLIPDPTFSHKINVFGTETLLEACRRNHVTRFIYCSSIEVVTGYESIRNGTEASTSHSQEHLFKVYSATKIAAEQMVLSANDDTLQTLSLRPCVMYGELDFRYIGQSYQIGKKIGRYMRFETKNNVMEHAYVGNVAWGFVSADKYLFENEVNAADVTGNAFFVCDDSPRKGMFDFLELIFSEVGLKPNPVAIPRWIIIYFLYLLYVVCSLISLVYPVNFWYSPAPFHMMGRCYTFSCEKAKRLFGYKPLFTYEEAKARSVKFLKTL